MKNVEMTVEGDGVRIRATSDGPAYILLPVQFSHCLRVVNAAPVRLIRANLMQTLISFDRTLDRDAVASGMSTPHFHYYDHFLQALEEELQVINCKSVVAGWSVKHARWEKEPEK